MPIRRSVLIAGLLLAAATLLVPETSFSQANEGEPTFDAANHLSLLKEPFDYASFTDAVKGGWRCSNGSTQNDVTTNPAGACQLVAGRAGNAIRLVYDGKSNGDGQEAHAWSRQLDDQQAGRKAMYISYWFRINPGAGFTLDLPQSDASSRTRLQVKWLMLWNSDGSDRAQFSTSYSYCVNNLPQTLWNFYARGAGANPMKCQGGQVRPPFARDGAGEWHRATHKYVTQSAPGAQDGVAQMWVDGSLIVSVDKMYCGNPVPNNAGSNPQTWCEAPDLDSFFVNDFVRSLTLGSVQTGPLWPFSIDYDDFTIWRDR